MPTIRLTGVPEELYDRLRGRARANGRSPEEEALLLLQRQVEIEQRLADSAETEKP